MSELHVHARGGHVQFFRDDLRKRRADTRAEIDMTVEGENAAVVEYRDEHLRRLGHERREAARLAGRGLDGLCGWSRDSETAFARKQFGAVHGREFQ